MAAVESLTESGRKAEPPRAPEEDPTIGNAVLQKFTEIESVVTESTARPAPGRVLPAVGRCLEAIGKFFVSVGRLIQAIGQVAQGGAVQMARQEWRADESREALSGGACGESEKLGSGDLRPKTEDAEATAGLFRLETAACVPKSGDDKAVRGEKSMDGPCIIQSTASKPVKLEASAVKSSTTGATSTTTIIRKTSAVPKKAVEPNPTQKPAAKTPSASQTTTSQATGTARQKRPSTEYLDATTCMPEYATKSVEELRSEDYEAGNKGAQQAGVCGQRGVSGSQPASTPSGEAIRASTTQATTSNPFNFDSKTVKPFRFQSTTGNPFDKQPFNFQSPTSNPFSSRPITSQSNAGQQKTSEPNTNEPSGSKPSGSKSSGSKPSTSKSNTDQDLGSGDSVGPATGDGVETKENQPQSEESPPILSQEELDAKAHRSTLAAAVFSEGLCRGEILRHIQNPKHVALAIFSLYCNGFIDRAQVTDDIGYYMEDMILNSTPVSECFENLERASPKDLREVCKHILPYRSRVGNKGLVSTLEKYSRTLTFMPAAAIRHVQVLLAEKRRMAARKARLEELSAEFARRNNLKIRNDSELIRQYLAQPEGNRAQLLRVAVREQNSILHSTPLSLVCIQTTGHHGGDALLLR